MRRQHGLTIIECLIAMTILSIVVLVTCHTLVAGHQHVQYGDRMAAAARLGRDMLEEVTSRGYRDATTPLNFGPEIGEARAQFDDVDDYNGYAEPAGALADFAGNGYPDHDQFFSRRVAVTPATHTVVFKEKVTNANVPRDFPGVRVVVTVRAANGEEWQFSRLIPEPGL